MSTQTNNTLIKYSGVEICQKEQVVLKDVSIEISAGEFYYLIGSVGSGKSSLLKTIYAELPITEGEAQVFDFDLNEIKQKEIPYLRRQMGIIFQDFQLLMDRTVYENLYFVLINLCFFFHHDLFRLIWRNVLFQVPVIQPCPIMTNIL